MVTIITATKDVIKSGRREAFVRCVESVAKITVEHEHVIVDGASTDGTVDLIAELAKENGSIKWFSEIDSGIYNAFNKGIAKATGEWIYFIGSDDYVFAPSVFDDVIKGVSDGCDMVISPVRHSDGSKLFADKRLFRNILIIKHYCHQGVMMKKSLIERLGGFDESYKIGADYKMCLLAHLRNVRCRAIWKEYAEFSIETGVSHHLHDTEFKERVRVPTELFGLNNAEVEYLAREQMLPMRIIVKLLLHRNAIIRYGARHALKRRIARAIGVF